jgi:hypothetical protein
VTNFTLRSGGSVRHARRSRRGRRGARHYHDRGSKAWRFWSVTDPALHQATYQFPDKASLDRATNGEEMKRLVADVNRDWPDVTRTREILVLAEEFGSA